MQGVFNPGEPHDYYIISKVYLEKYNKKLDIVEEVHEKIQRITGMSEIMKERNL